MKQTRPKVEKELVDKVTLDRYRHNNTMFHQIWANVHEFAQEGDNAVDCVLRILEGYYSAKAEVYELLRRKTK
jgi:hypothetical protein